MACPLLDAGVVRGAHSQSYRAADARMMPGSNRSREVVAPAESASWVPARSGLRLDPLDPDPSQIRLDDIAHGLSHCCRYNGQTERFYSVAEHSVRLSLVVKAGKCAALMHDAAEAYMGDLVLPVKCLEIAEPYREIEDRLLGVILRKFGVPPANRAVRVMDEAMALAEQWNLDLFRSRDHFPALCTYPESEEWVESIYVRLGWLGGWGWGSAEAKQRFLCRAKEFGIRDTEH